MISDTAQTRERQRGSEAPALLRRWRSLTERDRILLLFVVGLVSRLGFILGYGIDAPLVAWGDDTHYDEIARKLVFERSWENSWFPPGYPLLLAAVYSLFGRSLIAVRLLQAALGAATCCLTYVIGRRAFSTPVGGFAGALLSVYPGHLFMSWRLMAETLYIFLIALGVLFAVKVLAAPTMRHAAAVALALGAANAVKSNLLIFTPLVVLLLSASLLRRRPRRPRVALAIVVLSLLTALVTPAANLIASGGEVAPLPGNAGHTLWWSNNPVADGYFVVPEGMAAAESFIERHGMKERLELSDPFERDRIYRRLALLWIQENPRAFLELCWKKLANAYGPFPRAAIFEGNRLAKWVHLASYGGLLPFMLIGLVVELRRWRCAIVLYLVLLSYTIMLLIFYGTPRFTVIVIPYLLLFAASGAIAAWRFTARRRHEGAEG